MSSAKVLWFTGLSGSGKSTIASGLAERIVAQGQTVKIIDGDEIRKAHKELTFHPDDIKKNNWLVTQICVDLLDQYDYLIVSVITPYRASRAYSKSILKDQYIEVFIKASLETVIQRDVKGLYKKALSGEIENFIGISNNTPYEEPEQPNIYIETERLTIKESIQEIQSFLKSITKVSHS